MPLGDNSYIIQAYETISNINVELDIDIRVTAGFWNYSAEFLNPERKKMSELFRRNTRCRLEESKSDCLKNAFVRTERIK